MASASVRDIFADLMTTLNLRWFVLLVLSVALSILVGCGSEDPQPATNVAPTGPPGAIAATVFDRNSIATRKIEVRLLQIPPAGQVGEGGDLTIIATESVRDVKEGTEMTLVRKVETDDFGKFKFDGVPPGKYLLSAGTLTTGIWREWITVEPGKTLIPTIKLPARK